MKSTLTRIQKRASGLPPIVRLASTDAGFPEKLRHSAAGSPPRSIAAIGCLELLKLPTLALLCSVRCPGNLILRTYDYATHLSPADGLVIVSGFHSPMERQCLEVFLRRGVPVIICPARGLNRIRLPLAWRAPIAENRLLVISAVPENVRRPTRTIARDRNRFVAALADRVLLSHAAPGSKTLRFAIEIRDAGKLILTFRSDDNLSLIRLGAVVVEE